MVDIFNELMDGLDKLLPECTVCSPSQNVNNSFPVVTLEEIANSTHYPTVDSSGETASNLSYEVCIYTSGSKRESDCRIIRDKVNNLFSSTYNMNREVSQKVPNYVDNNIYRYILRYSCIVTKNNVIYRR